MTMIYFILSLIPSYIYLYFSNKKALHMLQQNWYNDSNRYIKWVFNNYDKSFMELDIFFPFLVLGVFINSYLFMGLYALFYLVIFYFFNKKTKNEQSKKPLVITSRIKRLMFTTYLIYLIPLIYITLNYNSEYLGIYYLFLSVLIFINYLIVLLSNYINIPAEKYVYYYYKSKALNKLKSMNGLSVIGVTGSYGKTSVKNIVNEILNVKYNSYATPKSFNTPYGIIGTINNNLDKFNDFFVAEMGAFYKGEIKGMCDLFNPKYGILTKIGTAHLDTFGSQDNIQQGKFELIESLPSDGVGFLNLDDPLQVNYKLKNKVKIMWYSIGNKDADVYAKDIKLNSNGTSFKIVFKGDKKEYDFETKLLGKANVYNILSGILVGNHLKMTPSQLQMGVKKIKPIEHRLELKQYGKITIIDDAYNSNPEGAEMALEVLSMMPGKKIVVTPGMIELGTRQYELNMILGKQISKVADHVILVGKEQTKPIFDGLMVTDFDIKKIDVINDVKDAFKIIQKIQEKDTYVLLENDLPDLFNE
jgi:UDP-N-acetylmuramoyl-tripeptide--D-alanyl-D-alanine ligase